jgi:hypothetical protein
VPRRTPAGYGQKSAKPEPRLSLIRPVRAAAACYRSAMLGRLEPHGPGLRKLAAPDSCKVLLHGISAGQVMITMCPRTDSHPTYMIDIALTTEFALAAADAR